MTDQQSTTSASPIMIPTTQKTVTLSTLLDGKWIENEYQLNDQDWRDVLKLMRGTGISVRLAYK
jgi:hypothetical protein